MKRIFTIIVLALCLKVSAQEKPTVMYFGGIYENTAYFNWVFKNNDTCAFTVELSYDGDNYEAVAIKDSLCRPVPVPVMHGYQFKTCEQELWFRVVAKTSGAVFVFQAQPLCKDKYTYEPKLYAPHPVHGNF